MSYDPNDFQDQAAVAAMLQRQRMINAQNQQQNIPKNRQCPWCGGALPGICDKCQHCTSGVSWVDGLPYKPQEAEYRERKSTEKWLQQQAEAKRSRDKARKLKSEIAARVVECKKCNCRVPQTDLIITDNTCKKCADIEMFIYIIVAIAALIVCVTSVISFRAKQDQNQLLSYINVTIAALTVIVTLIIGLRAKNKHKQFVEAKAKAEQQAAKAKLKAETRLRQG